MSDTRQVELDELWESIPILSPTQGMQFLKVIVKGIHLLDEEEFPGDADNCAYDVCAYHSDWVSVKYWMHFTYLTRVAEFGEDRTRAAEVHGFHLNPKSIPMSGQEDPKKFTGIRV